MIVESKKSFCCVAASCTLWVVSALGQGTFQNLDFESPVLPLIPSGEFNHVSVTNALPGWTVYFGTNQYDQVRYNQVSIGSAAVSLMDTSSTGLIIQGNYTTVLYTGPSPIDFRQTSAGIGQTGTVPSDAQSLRFFATGQIAATFSGQTLSMVPIVGDPCPLCTKLYAADVSFFAGQVGELRFTAPNLSPLGPNYVFLDDILFSPQAVPEPSVVGLFCLGALRLSWRFWKRKA